MAEIIAFRADRSDRLIIINNDITPFEFCAEWLALDGISSNKKQAIIDKASGTRKICDQVLSSVLGVSDSVSQKWGADFERMPPRYQTMLAPLLLYRQLCSIVSDQSSTIIRFNLINYDSKEVAS